MARSGTETRERILDAAERLILDKSLSATSVDEILTESKSSKGAFFHHFPSKNHLARALVERYAANDTAFLDEIMAKAEAASDDPGRQVIAFLRLFEQGADETVSQQPSCLYVSYIYDKQLFVDGTNDVIAGAFVAWRERLAEKLREAAQAHPPRAPVDLDALADHLSTTYEGAFMMGRAIRDPGLMHRQLELVRQQVALLFGIPAD
jgi:TetR/AcrR family transcriptional regulator, transcriptional repressor for nem operon